MAISNRARAQLDAFAQEAEIAASMESAPWRLARLSASTPAANAGEWVSLNWSAPPLLPVFLRVGGDGAWEAVPHQGQREVQIELADLAVALRVGPRIAREINVHAVVPPPTLELFPGNQLRVPMGGKTTLEIYASHVREMAVREEGGTWAQLPSLCAVEISDVFAPRQLQLRATGWQGTVITRNVRVCVDAHKSDGLFEQMLREAARQ